MDERSYDVGDRPAAADSRPGGGTPEAAAPGTGAAGAIPAIPAEEETLLSRVQASLRAAAEIARRGAGPRARGGARAARDRRSEEELLSLRDEIGEARLEDVPQLVAQMERLQEVALTRGELQTFLIDPSSPYFGHLRLRENVPGRGVVERDVFIGRATFTDPKSRINIVDWRNAPVSQLYYRYAEGSDYEETFGDRDVEGDILIRRTVTIDGGTLLRIACPQGIWVKHQTPSAAGGPATATWENTTAPVRELAGGEQSASRPGRAPRARGVLGAAPEGLQRLDRHLPEIAALIDPRQFEIMTARGSGVVVIQGGAGSGKTTIGLHRLAYLAYSFPDQFPPRRMLVVTYGSALAAYIDQVLPALGIEGVRVLTFRDWAEREIKTAIPWLRATITDDVAPVVTRVKSHPALLHELERRADAYDGKRGSRAVVWLWAELLTDRARLLELVCHTSEMPIAESDAIEAHRSIVPRVNAILGRDPRDRGSEKKDRKGKKKAAKRALDPDDAADTAPYRPGDKPRPAATVDADLPEAVRRFEAEREDFVDDENIRGEIGIDGVRTEDDEPILDVEDLALLLRAHQLVRRQDEPLAHLFIDEAQDLSPVKLAVLIGRTGDIRGTAASDDAGKRSGTVPGKRAATRLPSVTLAGDTAQKLFLYNGFGDWRGVLGHLGLAHVAIEPLQIAYRSTREILALARHAMGPLASEVPPVAPRSGAPVEAFRFAAVGAAVAFLAEALRDLSSREPRASIALLARHPEQADRYYEGLARAEVPALRRVRAQEFTFRPGIEVTDVRQIKGLEFDYVVMLDANAASYGTDDESRHLFHIGVTRAAHQLWLIVTGTPTPLLPAGLLQD